MRHLSQLELRVLSAVKEHPRHGGYPLARIVGEQPEIVRSTLARLRRFELIDRDRIGLIGYSTFEITQAGERELREWSTRRDGWMLPRGVIGLNGPTRRRREGTRHGR